MATWNSMDFHKEKCKCGEKGIYLKSDGTRTIIGWLCEKHFKDQRERGERNG
jgi:hypothetical protein